MEGCFGAKGLDMLRGYGSDINEGKGWAYMYSANPLHPRGLLHLVLLVFVFLVWNLVGVDVFWLDLNYQGDSFLFWIVVGLMLELSLI